MRFWFGDDAAYGKPSKAWFVKNPEFDREIRARFLPLYDQAAVGELDHWQSVPGECLALVIALDQFPRNLFRGEARAFASDAHALGTARRALEAEYDADMLPVERLFLYLPFEHSESLEDQWRAMALIGRLAPWPETADTFPCAVRHWDVVRRFGRFPHRNAALGRGSTPEELEFLKQPGSGF